MKRDPNFLGNMKQQLRNVLDEELVKRGIPLVGGAADAENADPPLSLILV